MTGPRWDNAEQGSAGWVKARLGVLTASRMAEAMSFLKNGNETADRRNLRVELLTERITDRACDHYVTPAMMWGIEQEDAAKALYEEKSGKLIKSCGFALHGSIEYFGASPDGLVDDGLIETKCPTSTTHMAWLLDGVVPEKHKPQMCAQMIVTGRKWCDFVSFDPRFPDPHRIFIQRYTPTQEELDNTRDHAIRFLAEVEAVWDRLIQGDYLGKVI